LPNDKLCGENQPMSNALQTNSQIKSVPDKRKRISARLKSALDSMIWPDETGYTLDYYEAARRQNITTRSMRKSWELPHVRMYLRSEAEVFRATLNAKTLSRLAELGWQNTNMNAAVVAVKAIRGEEEQVRSSNAESTPWLTIRLVGAAPEPKVVEHIPAPIEPEPLPPDAHLDPMRDLPAAQFRWPRDE
jgi:hypothetical protein